MILVAGGTGRLGSVLTGLLARRGLPVRILTRDPARAAGLTGPGIEVVTGDVRDRSSLAAAVRGADVVVSAVHGFAGPGGVSPVTVDLQGNINLIDAAREAGADFILISVVGAAAGSPMELARMKHAAEQYLRASGAGWTIVRATAFLELWIDVLTKTAARSGRPVVFGRGNNPVNFVSVTDVAALVEHAVTDPAARGRILEIGGPAAITFNELAAAVQAAAGRTSPPRHVPPPILRIMAGTVGKLSPELGRKARAALIMDSADFSHDATSIRQDYPGLPCTTLSARLHPDGCIRA